MTDSGFRVLRMFHPSHRVPSLEAAEDFYTRVFGRPSTRQSAMLGMAPTAERPDYSTFTVIADVLMDNIDPRKLWVNAVPADTDVQPHLHNTGWYVDDPDAAFRAVRAAGITATDQPGDAVEGDEAPKAGGVMPMFFTRPEQIGQRYQVTITEAMPTDPRHAADWDVPEVSDDDPLGIRRCSHHTILTRDPSRGLRFVVDALSGTVVHEGRNEVLGTASTYVHLGDGILEYAVPDAGTPAEADLASRAPEDSYHCLTWTVADLDRVATHLAAEGVKIRNRTDTALVTDPATSLGIPWAFTTEVLPGDPRG
ncbi:MAG: glyoxalase/bleomycin resistance/dioxygenase family protein [Pseudonocardia sp.]|nr:glyoxalase/bleomycin resistance/dioxygenase family protein [Pseudonocardia sp.]